MQNAFDIIIVGAGSAGCALAIRFSAITSANAPSMMIGWRATEFIQRTAS